MYHPRVYTHIIGQCIAAFGRGLYVRLSFTQRILFVNLPR